eukprot:2233898-Pleurochrysis_carterae.AAC.1
MGARLARGCGGMCALFCVECFGENPPHQRRECRQEQERKAVLSEKEAARRKGQAGRNTVARSWTWERRWQGLRWVEESERQRSFGVKRLDWTKREGALGKRGHERRTWKGDSSC